MYCFYFFILHYYFSATNFQFNFEYILWLYIINLCYHHYCYLLLWNAVTAMNDITFDTGVIMLFSSFEFNFDKWISFIGGEGER